MELTHEFTVPAGVQETWDALNDIEGVAGCFPGATVTSAEGDTFQGSCKVKLGPIALVYNGSGTFVEKDETTRTMRIEAKGKDKRGNGTAGADVTATMAEAAGGGTVVTVVTELAITGKPAQFGRGVMQDVSDRLLGQFVDCLAGRLGDGGAPDEDGAPDEGLQAAAATTGADPADVEAGTRRADARLGDDVQDRLGAPGDGGSSTGDGGVASGGALPTPPRTAGGTGARQGDDALDLGAAVLPVLLRSYGKQAAAVAAVLFLLGWLVRRRS